MFIYPLIATLLVSQVTAEPPPKIGKTSDIAFAFDWEGKSISGEDVGLDAAEFIFRPKPIGLPLPPPIRVLRSMTPIVVGENFYKVKTLLVDIPPGIYTITVRVRNVGGEWSDESQNRLTREIVAKKPRVPTNFRDVGR